jgi:uncharacterized protein YjaZ
MGSPSLFASILVACLLVVAGCSSSDDKPICGNGTGIALDHESCLVFEDNGELDDFRDAIESVTRDAIALINNAMPIEGVKITVRAAPADVIPEIGLGGFNPNTQEAIISIDPAFPDLAESIAVELAPQLAHELHHAMRRRTVGYGSSLLEAVVSEGLADCFAIEVTGINPPIWSLAVTGGALDDLIEMASATWTDPPYDHSGWFVGTDPDIPRWAGYSMGYRIVKDYLAKNPARNASDLFDEPASSFVD